MDPKTASAVCRGNRKKSVFDRKSRASQARQIIDRFSNLHADSERMKLFPIIVTHVRMDAYLFGFATAADDGLIDLLRICFPWRVAFSQKSPPVPRIIEKQ